MWLGDTKALTNLFNQGFINTVIIYLTMIRRGYGYIDLHTIRHWAGTMCSQGIVSNELIIYPAHVLFTRLSLISQWIRSKQTHGNKWVYCLYCSICNPIPVLLLFTRLELFVTRHWIREIHFHVLIELYKTSTRRNIWYFYNAVYIYKSIKWTVIINVTTKSAQHAHVRMMTIGVEKVQAEIIYATMALWMY